MGELDDAIKEHLELLRRRGADPTEIARAEADALGPVVREVAAPEERSEDTDFLAGTAPSPSVAEDEIVAAEHSVEDEEFIEDEAGSPSPAAEVVDEPGQRTELFDAFADDEVAEDVAEAEGDFDDLSLRAHDAAVSDEIDELGFEDEELDDEELVEEEPIAPSSSPDVLEETPDFLAESPDHDKLWFEQSGPRDFDFEGDK